MAVIFLNRLMACVLFIGCFGYSFEAYTMGSGNLGHRVGAGNGEINSHLPENSILALRSALLGEQGQLPIQDMEAFTYLEFDIQETSDHHLVLFHDDAFSRLLPNDSVNKNAIRDILRDPATARRVGKSQPKYSDLRIHYLTLAQLKTLRLYKVRSESVPTLKEFLDKAKAWDLRKPFAAEIKWIHSDQGRKQYLDLLKSFRDSHFRGRGFVRGSRYNLDRGGATILSFPGAFSDSFGKENSVSRRHWCGTILSMGFQQAFRARQHDQYLCD